MATARLLPLSVWECVEAIFDSDTVEAPQSRRLVVAIRGQADIGIKDGVTGTETNPKNLFHRRLPSYTLFSLCTVLDEIEYGQVSPTMFYSGVQSYNLLTPDLQLGEFLLLIAQAASIFPGIQVHRVQVRTLASPSDRH